MRLFSMWLSLCAIQSFYIFVTSTIDGSPLYCDYLILALRCHPNQITLAQILGFM